MSAKKKNALGRGMNALFAVNTEVESKSKGSSKTGKVPDIDISLIDANPLQPRSEFEAEALKELADSIKVHGIIQPVTVRLMDNGRYQLISGERRLRAAKMAGLNTIPGYIRSADDTELLEMALVENIQRENLNAIEISISFQRLIEECNLTQDELSKKLSKNRTTVTNYLRLLRLPVEIQYGIKQAKISMGHARALINITDQHRQIKLYHEILHRQLSVRQVEEAVRHINEEKLIAKKPKARKTSLPVIDKAKTDLSEHFKVRVNIRTDGSGKGSISIPFGNKNEFERIVTLFNLKGK
ncbi:MAG: ParB/RepB/Spo0J family partition protein [Bacteroidota bacterium]